MKVWSQRSPLPKWPGPAGLMLFLGLWLFSASAFASTLFVSDTTLEANLRTGSTTGNRIIALLRPGTRVTLVGEENGWAEVTLEDGRTGWILKRYLSERPPWRLTAQKLMRENQGLQVRLNQLEGERQKLLQENARLKRRVSGQQRELDSVRKQYNDLKKGAANYLDLKMVYENLQTEARNNKARLEQLQRDYKKLQLSRNIRWFLSGAGVLLLGWLVGLSMGRMRRRRSMDYYKL